MTIAEEYRVAFEKFWKQSGWYTPGEEAGGTAEYNLAISAWNAGKATRSESDSVAIKNLQIQLNGKRQDCERTYASDAAYKRTVANALDALRAQIAALGSGRPDYDLALDHCQEKLDTARAALKLPAPTADGESTR